MPIAAPHPLIHIWSRRVGFRAIVSNLGAQAHDRFLLVPILLAAGIAVYFALPFEPETDARFAVFSAELCNRVLGV